MAATTFESNTLLLVNVADGKDSDTQYYVHIRYTDDPEKGPLVDTPATYIGIYVGPEGTPPDDLALYKWSKYGGESSYIDIRYSSTDGANKSLTLDDNDNPSGLTPGPWMGILITDNPKVLDPNWWPTENDIENVGIKISDYTWSLISQPGSDGIVYYLKYDYNNKAGNIYKFATGNSLYAYSPEKFKIIAHSRVGSYDSKMTSAELTCEIYYSYIDPSDPEQKREIISSFPDLLTSQNGLLEINLNNYPSFCIEFLVINCYENGVRLLTETKDIPFGTKKDMAQLSINAKDIVASIQNSKLTFNTEGLIVTNGGLQIKNNADNTVFKADEQGDLLITGIINATGGTIGPWKINQYGLYSEQELTEAEKANNVIPLKPVGLYCGGNLIYPEGKNNSPIRIWAGEYWDSKIEEGKETTFPNYNFVVTEDGTFYSKDATITGTIFAKSGHIENDFYIGSDIEKSIVIHGGSGKSDSYISTGTFASGSLGYGWRISQNGTAEFSNITARGKISSSVFEYNKISSIGGSLYIAPTIYTELESLELIKIGDTRESENEYCECQATWELPFLTKEKEVEITDEEGNISKTYITVLDNAGGRDWSCGEQIKIDGEILIDYSYVNDEWQYKPDKLELSNINGVIHEIAQKKNSKTTLLTINLSIPKSDATLLFDSPSEEPRKFLPGTIFILYGSDEHRHGLYLTAQGEGSPYLDVYDDSENNTVKPAVRIGNLSGVTDTNFPQEALEGYGLYSSNAFLRGQLMLPGAGITNQSEFVYGTGDAASPIRIWAGINEVGSSITNANFIVTANGYLYAKQGIFEGTVIARNSEFSGTIKAAGIVVDNPKTPDREALSDHFFVAYKDDPSDFNDYILNIDYTGLSIWEGGLRAYSDKASSLDSQGNPVNPIYGYEKKNYNSPLPYFNLVDDINENELNSRVVMHKGHFFEVEKTTDGFQTHQVVIDRGIWFASLDLTNNAEIENSAFYTVKNSKKMNQITGIHFINNNLQIKSVGNLLLSPHINSTVYIGATEEDIQSSTNKKMFIRGQLQLVNANAENLISFEKCSIRETKINKVPAGIDIIVS